LLWFDHPKYVRTRDDLIARIQSSRYRFRRHGLSIFLCGGAGSKARDRLRAYLDNHIDGLLGVFYAERVWEHIVAAESKLSALEMEAELANLADIVVLIVESPGTFAELGAFSLSNELRTKLLPIVDQRYKGQESFILTGPIRWIDRDSNFRPTIYTPLSSILECVDEIEERLKRIPRSRSTKVSDLASSRKHLLFFLCDLVAVTYPVTIPVLQHYVSQIVAPDATEQIEVATLVGLAEAMGLLHRRQVTIRGIAYNFYGPTSSAALVSPYHHRMMNDLQTQRAIHIATLLSFPEAKHALAAFDPNQQKS